MNLALELAEIEKQVSALISENINLKKENKELTEQNTSLLTSVENLNKSVQELEAQIAELEKENAELKGLVNQYKASKCGSISLVNRNMIMFDQLTKAKELLERLLITSCNSDVLNLLPNCSEVLRVRAEAEQFLNSEVEK